MADKTVNEKDQDPVDFKKRSSNSEQITDSFILSKLSDEDVTSKPNQQSISKTTSRTSSPSRGLPESKENVPQETTGFKITPSLVSGCRRDEIGHFVNDLMIKIFGYKELFKYSAKGRQSGYNKALGILPKPVIPQDKMQAITEYAYSKFGGEIAINKKLLTKAVREVLSSAHAKYATKEKTFPNIGGKAGQTTKDTEDKVITD